MEQRARRAVARRVLLARKYWILLGVVGIVVLFVSSTKTEWSLLRVDDARKDVSVQSKVHALNHLAAPYNATDEAFNGTHVEATSPPTSVEPSRQPTDVPTSVTTGTATIPDTTAPATSTSPATASNASSSAQPTTTAQTTTPSAGNDFENVAIVAYVPPGNAKFVREAQRMLWSSWHYSTRQVNPASRGKTDLIFFAHRDVMDQLPESCVRLADASQVPPSSAQDQCFVVEQTPAADDYWHRYSFMFSLTFLAEPKLQPLLMSYDRLLRTDTDVVVTPAFLTFRPREFVVGRGGYMIEDYTKARIKEVAADLGLTHQSLYNVGSTWFGNASLMLQMVPKMMEVAKFILESPKYNVDQGFPRWHVGVASMYAGELVVNQFIPKDNVWVNMDSLDINCNGQEKTADVYHSHCWPGEYQGHFKKWAFERGEYTPDTFPRDKLDISVINDYFMAMALYGY